MSPTEPQPKPKRGLIRRTLRDWWLPILAIWFLGSALLGGLVYAKFKPMYRASSLLMVEPLSTDLYGVRGNEDLETYLQTQVNLITSPNVLATAGHEPKAVALPRIQQSKDVGLELKRVIQVGVIGGTSLLEVSMTSGSPAEVAVLVNAVVDAYLESNVEWSEGTTRKQKETLVDYMEDLKRKSGDVERQWKQLISKGDLDLGFFAQEQGPDGEVKNAQKGPRRSLITLDQFKQVHQELFETRLELAMAEGWLKAVQDSIKAADEKIPTNDVDEARLLPEIEGRFKQDPQVIELASQMVEIRAKLEEVRKSSKPGDPAEQEVLKKLKALETRYDQLWGVKSRQIRKEMLANHKNLDGELLDAEAKVRALSVKQATLQAEFDQLDVKNRRQASDQVDIALILDQRESLKAMQEAVNRRLEQINFETRSKTARIRLYNPATPPGAPISDSRMPMMALIPWVMLPISFAFFLGVEALSVSPVPPSTVPAKEEPPAEV
jgi:hypothetical protein